MAVADTKPTRIAADLFDAASAEGEREGRSGKQQLEFWARIGFAFTMHETAERRRVEAALAGSVPMASLAMAERAAMNAELDARISTAAQGMSFADRLAAQGVVTVSTDSEGRLVERHPDGSTVLL